MKKEDIITGELIGQYIQINQKNGNKDAGTIIDETKNMLVVKTKEAEKKFIKTECELTFGEIKINGAEIATRPEERIKKWLRRKK